ncbi:MAG: type II toxin-antitoxin system Phd/YefM family antitoxin [bacterium]|nr:type II toxin-antitoxin system Phd/YefM family antitoxin [bacterium]
MADRITASKLRENVYRILDQVLESGRPVEIERRGRTVRLVPVEPPSRLSRLKRRRFIKGDPEALVHLDWSKEWKP